MSIPHGIITAIVTPFMPDGSIDYHSYEKLIQEQIDAKISAVIPCGTTGESPTLTTDEKKELILKTIELCKNTQTKVLAGTGSNSTSESIALSKWASTTDLAGLLIVSPYYNKPTQAGIIAHFTAIADAVSLPIMLYNVPGRTGMSMTATTVFQLASHKNITCIKEATGNVHLSSEIFYQTQKINKSFDIFSGDDSLFVPILSIGGCGVVSVASNLIPSPMVEMWNLHKNKKYTELAKMHVKFSKLFSDLFIESNPAPVKWALSHKKIIKNNLRLPLLPLSNQAEAQLKSTLSECGAL